MPLIETNPEAVMLCTDDCHPDDLEKGYINLLVKRAFKEGYNIFNVLTAATKTAVEHYKLNIGLVQENDDADFIVINNLDDFTILSTFIQGKEVYNGKESLIKNQNKNTINNFYPNEITIEDIKVKYTSGSINVIQIVPDSLLTHRINYKLETKTEAIPSNTNVDVLKIVVLNRYAKAKPSVGFIQGFGLKHGAIAGSIAHDSHNICAVGTSDEEIIKAIKEVQKTQGGLVVVNENETLKLSLPIAGLMSDKNCVSVAKEYKTLSEQAKKLGCTLHAPFMTLAFMSLLVIPELKLSDKGLFDVNKFDFITLQN
jgi:adenine deaminase